MYPIRLDALVRDYELAGVLVEPEHRLAVITADPDDNLVLECAVAGFASYIVSGDRRLLTIGIYQQTPILNPRTFSGLLVDETRVDVPDPGTES